MRFTYQYRLKIYQIKHFITYLFGTKLLPLMVLLKKASSKNAVTSLHQKNNFLINLLVNNHSYKDYFILGKLVYCKGKTTNHNNKPYKLWQSLMKEIHLLTLNMLTYTSFGTELQALERNQFCTFLKNTSYRM